MKLWFTTRELVGLPGLPKDRRPILAKADREQWRWRQRAGKGGGREYAIDNLPVETRTALALRAAESGDEREPAETPIDRRLLAEARAGLNGTQRAALDASAWILSDLDQFHGRAGLSWPLAYRWYARSYNDGAVAAPDEVLAAYPTVSPGGLKKWREKVLREGVAGLARKWGQHRKGSGFIDSHPEIRDLVVGMLAAMPHVDAAQVMRVIDTRHPDLDCRGLSVRSLRRWISGWKEANAAVFEAVRNPDQFRRRRTVAFGSASDGVLALNQVWELDSTPTDIITEDGRRHAVVGCVDVWSRRVMFIVAPTSRAVAVTALLRKAILAWGVPATVKTDNGADYVSKHVRRVLLDLGVTHDICPPFSPNSKPHIERVLGTMSHQLMELLPGYIGHDVVERKAIEHRKTFAARHGGESAIQVGVSSEELQAKVDDWAEYAYGRAVHGGLDGMSPFEKACTWTAPVARVGDERALDMLLAEAPGQGGYRQVTNKGIRLDRGTFIAPELGRYIGEQVAVRYDPMDLGVIYVFEAETGQFVCKAECPERTGIDRRKATAAAKADQKQFVGEKVRALKREAAAITPERVAEEWLRREAEKAGRVVALPRPAADHVTEALIEAGLAARADEAPAPAPETAVEREKRDALILEMATAKRQGPPPDEKKERFRRALAIEARAAGTWGDGKPGAEALEWLERYRQTAEYRAMAGMYADFGDMWLNAGPVAPQEAASG